MTAGGSRMSWQTRVELQLLWSEAESLIDDNGKHD
jgi:hypothetical protein